jgi:hypothetical protein
LPVRQRPRARCPMIWPAAGSGRAPCHARGGGPPERGGQRRGLLNEGLPEWTLTLALGAWKHAHFAMPACAMMGALRLVDIGVAAVPGAARVLGKARCSAGGRCAQVSARAAGIVAGRHAGRHAAVGAGRLARRGGLCPPADRGRGAFGCARRTGGEPGRLPDLLADGRYGALLVGPGLGRDDAARASSMWRWPRACRW